ncbi:MAG: DUF3393 domain-containing protein [Campylobacterales bacterium]|nr:DUF3393 domain-containing protein [Campylobacterales bacterium]
MRLLIASLLSATLLFCQSSSQESGVEAINAAFEAYKKQEDNAFLEYTQRLENEFQAYKKELTPYWEEAKLSTQKEWVHYSADKLSRSGVDFEKGTIKVEVLAKDVQSAKEKIKKQLEYVASKTTKEVVESDELQKRIAKLSIKERVDEKPILQTVIFNKPPSQKDISEYALDALKSGKKSSQNSKLKDQILYTLEVSLPSDTHLKRSQVYKQEVMKNAQRFHIPHAVIFAVMQTESDFNPFAKSHIPAFGLMQIVPHSAGKDSFKLLHKKEGMPSASYLYNSQKNIEMGTSYLYILYYKYLKSIQNPQSRLYCAIAAYNTGAGNIAWAYTKQYDMKKAAPLINEMSSEEVYKHLIKNLRYSEPREYLKKVRKRMSAYKKAYNS